MNTWNVMLVEQDDYQRQHFVQLLENESTRTVTTATDVEEAISLLYRQPVDVLVLGNSLTETDERKLRKVAGYQQPELLVVNATGELADHVSHAINLLETGKRPEIRFVDDALKHAGIPVLVQ